MTKNGLINETPEDIAKFMYKNDGLNKVKIGEYLGEKYVINCSGLEFKTSKVIHEKMETNKGHGMMILLISDLIHA